MTRIQTNGSNSVYGFRPSTVLLSYPTVPLGLKVPTSTQLDNNHLPSVQWVPDIFSFGAGFNQACVSFWAASLWAASLWAAPLWATSLRAASLWAASLWAFSMSKEAQMSGQVPNP